MTVQRCRPTDVEHDARFKRHKGCLREQGSASESRDSFRQSPRPDVFLVGLDEIADRIPGPLKTAFPVRAGSGHKVDIRRGRPSLAGANVHSEGVDLIVKPNREPDAMQPRALVAGTLGQLGSRKRERRARDEDQSPPYPTRAALARSRTPAAQLR